MAHREGLAAGAAVPLRDDILNIGGFSGAVFDAIAAFLTSDAARFVTEG